MRLCPGMCWSLGLVAALVAAPEAASAATFVVQQPAVGVPLVLSLGGKTVHARIDLPSIVETIEVMPGRAVRMLANEDVPAMLELAGESRELAVRLERAAFIADENGRARFSRVLRAADGELDLAVIRVEGQLDLFGLGGERAVVSVIEANVAAVEQTRGVLAGAKLAAQTMIASRAFPLELVAPESGLELELAGEVLSGEVVLEKPVSPEAIGERAVVQLFDRDGVVRGKKLAAQIVWTKRDGRWTGSVSAEARDVSGEIARATITLGDASSIIVVQASGAVTTAKASKEEHAAR